MYIHKIGCRCRIIFNKRCFNTISGVELIVGARTGSSNLLLYLVFKIGSPTNNLSWQSYEKITSNPKVKWALPLSLGDSHKGFRVLGTTQDYFNYFSYGKQHPLILAKGTAFEQTFDVVLGAQVAKKLQYQLGDRIVLAHGIAKTSFSLHNSMYFMLSILSASLIVAMVPSFVVYLKSKTLNIL